MALRQSAVTLAFLKYIQVFISAETSTYVSKAYMREILTQVWLKSIKKWLSYLTNK